MCQIPLGMLLDNALFFYWAIDYMPNKISLQSNTSEDLDTVSITIGDV